MFNITKEKLKIFFKDSPDAVLILIFSSLITDKISGAVFQTLPYVAVFSTIMVMFDFFYLKDFGKND